MWDGDRDYRRYLALRRLHESGQLTREQRSEYEELSRSFATWLLRNPVGGWRPVSD
jgi:hypothetical protein